MDNSETHTTTAAEDAAGLVYTPARQLATELASGARSAREVMTAYLERIAECIPRVNAICTLRPRQEALQLADEADQRRVAGEALGLLLVNSSLHYAALFADGSRVASPVLLQYPLYGGVMRLALREIYSYCIVICLATSVPFMLGLLLA